MQTFTPWTIKHLYEALERDLAQCTTQLERDCCKALGGKEIREKAQQWAKERKLTPMEVAIAQRFGFKG